MTKTIDLNDIHHCIFTLDSILANPLIMASMDEAERKRLLELAGKLAHPDPEERKKRQKVFKQLRREEKRKKDKILRSETGIRKARLDAVFTAPKHIEFQVTSPPFIARELDAPRTCYICKAEYRKVHFFYDAMCPDCADFNYQKRFQTADLHGKVALITGSRLKIGYHATLMLLRAGAHVIATTRFPHDSALRYSQEEDFEIWKERLDIYGLDLRHTPSVEIFSAYVEQHYSRLDILINNAAQTVRRPPAFYAHLMDNERKETETLNPMAQILLRQFQLCKTELKLHRLDHQADNSAIPVSWHGHTAGIGLCESAQLSQIPYRYDESITADMVFPEGKLDADLQQVDLRKTNSWRYKLGEVPTAELLEVQLVNSIAPFVLCNRLISLMKRDFTGEKHIVNVSAMEGKFHRFKKASRHPHTNMAKAALNMLTHTAAAELAELGIYMNAVDTGWVTDEDPHDLAKFKENAHDFQPPLDIVDGAARVCDPLFDGILSGNHFFGKFLKDYKPIDW